MTTIQVEGQSFYVKESVSEILEREQNIFGLIQLTEQRIEVFDYAIPRIPIEIDTHARKIYVDPEKISFIAESWEVVK